MGPSRLRTGGIVAAIVVVVALVIAGSAATGVLPPGDRQAAPDTPGTSADPGPEPGTTSTPTRQTSSDGIPNSSSDVGVGDDPDTPPTGNVTVGDGSARGTTTYTLTNNGSESQRVTITAGPVEDPTPEHDFELEPGDVVRITFNGSANYSLTVDVLGGGSGTYDVAVDCNTRRTTLVIAPDGEIKRTVGTSTLMACLTETS